MVQSSRNKWKTYQNSSFFVASFFRSLASSRRDCRGQVNTLRGRALRVIQNSRIEDFQREKSPIFSSQYSAKLTAARQITLRAELNESLLYGMFEHPRHPRELWDLARAAKHVRECESDLKIAPTGPKLEKMRKSRKAEENQKSDHFCDLKYLILSCWRMCLVGRGVRREIV